MFALPIWTVQARDSVSENMPFGRIESETSLTAVDGVVNHSTTTAYFQMDGWFVYEN